MPKNPDDVPLSLLVAERGIKTSKDLVDMLGGLMADVIAGRVDGEAAMTACTISSHLLQVAEFQVRHSATLEQGLGDKKRLGDGA